MEFYSVDEVGQITGKNLKIVKDLLAEYGIERTKRNNPGWAGERYSITRIQFEAFLDKLGYIKGVEKEVFVYKKKIINLDK